MENSTKNDNTFYINSFFRELKDGRKTGIMFIGTKFEDASNEGKFVIYYIDSNNTGKKPFVILDTHEQKELINGIRTIFENELTNKYETSIEVGRLKLSIGAVNDEGDTLGLISFIYGGKSYCVPISRGELEVFYNSILYVDSYNCNDIESLKKLSTTLTEYTDNTVRTLLKNGTIKQDGIYKCSFIDTVNGKKRYDTPSIQHSIHGAKNVNGTLSKVHYYFKFFPTYLHNSFRKSSIDDNVSLERISGSAYPIHFITQETGQPSLLVTLSEIELSILSKFLKSPEFFRDNIEHPLVRYCRQGDIINIISDRYSIAMTNDYNGKKYRNEDIITGEQYNKIVELNNDIPKLVSYLKSIKLEKNKFINDITVGTLECVKNEFITYKVSRSDKGVINDKSSILQISYNVQTKEYIITTIRGDLNNGGYRHVSAPFKDNEAKAFLYKLSFINKYLTDISMIYLDQIDRDLKTLDFLNVPVEIHDTIGIDIKKIFDSKTYDLFSSGNDTKYQKKFMFPFGENIGIFSVYLPDVNMVYNKEGFNELDSIDGLNEHKYPMRFAIQNANGENFFSGFSLDLSDIGGIIEGNFTMLGKAKGKFRQLQFVRTNDNLSILYAESNSAKGPFDMKVVGTVEWNVFNGVLREYMKEIIVNCKTNTKKSILSHKFNILEGKKNVDNIEK